MLTYHNEEFVYDTIGNPTTYRGKTATWNYGRQLTSYDGNTFTYDARGRRTQKNNITFTYDSNGNLVKQSNGLEFFYDHTGVFAIEYVNHKYYFVKNIQGNILELLDSTGKVVVKYDYDAWGRCKTTVLDTSATQIAELNPFRYRGYYYDTETGLYFLKTRYYDSETGRFMTIDDISYLDPDHINGLNLYAYCLNNPVMYADGTGTFAISTFLISMAIGTLVSWELSAIFGEQIAGGIGAVAGGGTAISTGVNLCAFGPWGVLAGLTLIVIGAITMAFGANEIVAGITGTNYIQSWTGMSDGLYNGLYIGLNIASAVGSTIGNISMKYASTKILNSVMKNPELIQKYSIFQFKTYARYSNQWTLLPSKNGKGMRALSTINKGNSIRYGYGIYNEEHFWGEYYWIVANGSGKFRFRFN